MLPEIIASADCSIVVDEGSDSKRAAMLPDVVLARPVTKVNFKLLILNLSYS